METFGRQNNSGAMLTYWPSFTLRREMQVDVSMYLAQPAASRPVWTNKTIEHFETTRYENKT
jgi:hypothetical protein